MKSICCIMKKHTWCAGEYVKGFRKKPYPCACECHARHIAPTLEELKGAK